MVDQKVLKTGGKKLPEEVKRGRKPKKVGKFKKPPRSSRPCFRCGHNYSSHIDVGCLKIVKLKPEKVECDCKEFVKNEVELEISEKRLKAKEAKIKQMVAERQADPLRKL